MFMTVKKHRRVVEWKNEIIERLMETNKQLEEEVHGRDTSINELELDIADRGEMIDHLVTKLQDASDYLAHSKAECLILREELDVANSIIAHTDFVRLSGKGL
jgi:uncharacterized protein (DUF3084 family)